MTTTEQIKGIVERLVRWGGIFDVDAIMKFQTKKKNFALIFGTTPKKQNCWWKSRNKKKVEDYNKAVEMTDELQLAMIFYKEGELTAEELDEQYCLQPIILKRLNSKMLSDEGILWVLLYK
jgi:peptide chain release factor 2